MSISKKLQKISKEYHEMSGYDIYGTLCYHLSKNFKIEEWDKIKFVRNKIQGKTIWQMVGSEKIVEFYISRIGYTVRLV